MLREINSKLRKLILIIGSGLLVFKLIEGRGKSEKPDREGFQTEEFDDIW